LIGRDAFFYAAINPLCQLAGIIERVRAFLSYFTYNCKAFLPEGVEDIFIFVRAVALQRIDGWKPLVLYYLPVKIKNDAL